MAETLSRTPAKSAETFEPVRAEVVATPDDEQEPRFKGDLAEKMNEPTNAEQGQEAFDFNPREAFANLLRDAADRIAQVVETRGEKDEDGRAKLKRIGKGALMVGAQVGMVTAATTYLAAEAGGKVVTVIREKIIKISAAAKERFKERALRKEAIARNKRYDQEAEAEEMNIRYDEQTEAEEINQRFDEQTEAEAMNQRYNEQAEAEKMNERYDQQAEAEKMNELYDQQAEAEDMNAEFDQARRDAALRKQLALAAKARRKARRQEKYKGGREFLSAKGLGRIALKTFKFLKRGGKAAIMGATGAVVGAVGGAVVGAARVGAASAKAGWKS